MKKTIGFVLTLVLMFALFAPAASAADKTFVMGIDPEYPPFSYLGDDGEYTGFDVEVCKAVCDYLGWDMKIFGVNWDEKLVQLDSFECDCVWSGMTILDSMKEAGYVISEPYYDNTQVLVVKADSGFTSSKDLAGKIVAVQLGTSGESLLNGDLKDLADTFDSVLTCDSFLKCFTELQGGAVDAVFVDMPVAASQRGVLRVVDDDAEDVLVWPILLGDGEVDFEGRGAKVLFDGVAKGFEILLEEGRNRGSLIAHLVLVPVGQGG